MLQNLRQKYKTVPNCDILYIFIIPLFYCYCIHYIAVIPQLTSKKDNILNLNKYLHIVLHFNIVTIVLQTDKYQVIIKVDLNLP